ncbi:hypothetical protein LQK79_18080 [Clostridium guangxiense]|nr:hypothetical protein [Clostridium guangxiense]
MNTAPQWFMEESAVILGKIHKALEGISPLSEQNIIDLEYRIKLLDKVKDIKLNIDKFTYKNTHGDYFISQILCGEDSINAVIDFTSACCI